MSTNLSKLADELKPYFVPWVRRIAQGNGGSAGGSGGAPDMLAHELASTSALGTFHTVSGLTAGQVLKASGATTALFAQLQHGDLGGVSADQHHAQVHAHDSADHTGTLAWATVNKTGSSLGDLATRNYAQLNSRTHDIIGGDHSYSGGANLDVFGLSAASTLARLTPSADVSAGASALLRSNAGLLALKNINVNGALQSDSLNYAIGINVTPTGAAALDVRAGATDDHSMRIKQIAAQTGRLWRIENTSGQELIVLDSVGNLQSGNPGFVSGLTGWQITPAGNAEFNNGRFRGELHATVMVFDEVSVRNGTELITPAGGALELDVTIVSTGTPAIRNVRTTAFGDQDYLDYRTDSVTGSGTGITARTIENILSVKNPDTGHYQVFRAGEVLRMKVWTGSAATDTWMRVNSAVDMGTYYAYFVEVMSGTLPVTYRAGSAAAGYGKSGEGAIRLSADDPYGPLIDIFTSGAAPWAGDTYPHVRLGRLDGVGVPGLSGIPQYGIALGTNLADSTLPYMYASNLGVKQYNISSEWSDGANTTVRIEAGGRARFGTNVDSTANTFLDINPALGLATFRGAIEVLSGSSGYANLTDKPTLGSLAAGNNLDDVANGSTYARTNSTIISGGNIRVGSGTKDSSLNGWHIDSGEIVGQLAGADQVVLGTDGKITAGAGTVTIDALGLRISQGTVRDDDRSVQFTGLSNTVFASLGGSEDSDGYFDISLGCVAPAGDTARTWIEAQAGAGGNSKSTIIATVGSVSAGVEAVVNPSFATSEKDHVHVFGLLMQWSGSAYLHTPAFRSTAF